MFWLKLKINHIAYLIIYFCNYERLACIWIVSSKNNFLNTHTSDGIEIYLMYYIVLGLCNNYGKISVPFPE